jgi:hypothetical protein
MQWSSIIDHMKKEHNISARIAFSEHLQEKLCSKCKQIKPLTEFYKMKSDDAPLSSWCKECISQKNLRRIRRK